MPRTNAATPWSPAESAARAPSIIWPPRAVLMAASTAGERPCSAAVQSAADVAASSTSSFDAAGSEPITAASSSAGAGPAVTGTPAPVVMRDGTTRKGRTSAPRDAPPSVKLTRAM